MKSVTYRELGEFIATRRTARGWSQPELAARADVSQQTVSRWEQGASRPRFKELANLAALLEAEVAQLEELAGYSHEPTAGVPGGPTYDTPLPLQFLRPESFENFCMDLLQRLYRERGATVHRFGGPGSKQDGIDIEVRGQSFVHSFQCKQVKAFGDAKVHEAVKKNEFVADLNVLLLSNTASPQARKAIATYKDWQLWDKVDISAKFRTLSMVDRRDLVDIYFPGQRQPLLGELEAGPFQSADEFFKAFVTRDKYFNHTWELVGREPELNEVLESLQDDDIVAALMLGAPGNGKTRLLREVVSQVKERRPDTAVWFASTTEDVKLQHLEKLGAGRKLLVIDDAHDRDDLGQLLMYAAAPENKARLLISLRPYGRTMVESKAALAAIDSRQLAVVELRPRTRADAKLLAEKVLQACGADVAGAAEIAEYTYSTPLVTVLAAQIVARDKVPVSMLGNSKDVQSQIFAKLQTVIDGEIVSAIDAPKLQAVLRMTALLQPIVFDDPGFLNILREVEGLEQEDVVRMLRVLSEGGVLFKRGLRHRLAPDLLADDIIQRNFIDGKGGVTAKVEKVFEVADSQYLEHLLVNLGRLDWRLREGDTDNSVLLSSIAAKLQWHNEYHNPHIKAVQAVAYYQPQLALAFAKRLIAEGHGQVSGVCEMVRNSAYTLKYLEDACLLLWRAGKNDVRPLNQQPGHGIRILRELAAFEPHKPVVYVERVVQFALELLDRPGSLDGAYTPYTVLEGALRTDMEDMTSRGHTITLRRYKLDFDTARQVRERIITAIIDALGGNSPRKAFLAAEALNEALRSPMHSPDDQDEWDKAHARVLERAREVLASPDVHPAVLMKAATSVSWHALYNTDSPCQPIAQSIFKLLERDLPTRFIRLVVDAWGSDTWQDDDTFERKLHQADADRAIADLTTEYPDAARLYEFLSHWLRELSSVAGRGWGTPRVFIIALLQARPDLAEEVMASQAGPEEPMSEFAGVALAVMMGRGDRHSLISKVLDGDQPKAWELVSEAYARQPQDSFDDGDIAVLRRIFRSKEPLVLVNAATIARKLAAQDPSLAVELICSADFTASSGATRDFLMWMSHGDTFPSEAIKHGQWELLLEQLAAVARLDDHWARAFMRKAVAAHPTAVIGMLKERLAQGKSHIDYRPLRRDRNGKGLNLLAHKDGPMLLREFLNWAVENQAGGDLSKDIGSCVSGLCGKYGAEVQGVLLDLLAKGTQAHVDVVASVLRSAHQEFVVEEATFVRAALEQAERIGEQAVKDLGSALWSATMTGGRGGRVGEPFKEDLRLKAHCEKFLAGLSKLHPAHELYSGLLGYANQNIERQAREKVAMQAEMEEYEGEEDEA